jgi:4-amino-4-deoxy-L-arabinose transferase-like glycosyltransferase
MMSKPLLIFLISIFALHFGIFLYLAIKNKKVVHRFVSLTFALLVVSFFCRLWVPDLKIAEYNMHMVLRIAAWISTALVLFLTIRKRIIAHQQGIGQRRTLADIDNQTL